MYPFILSPHVRDTIQSHCSRKRYYIGRFPVYFIVRQSDVAQTREHSDRKLPVLQLIEPHISQRRSVLCMDPCKFFLLSIVVTHITQVAKFDPPSHSQHTIHGTEPQPENDQHTKHTFKQDDMTISNASSDTVQQADIVYVVSDIIHVYPSPHALRKLIHWLRLFRSPSTTCENGLILTFPAPQ